MELIKVDTWYIKINLVIVIVSTNKIKPFDEFI